MKKLHILHVVSNFGPGGAEMGIVRLAAKLAKSKYGQIHTVCSFGEDLSLASRLPVYVPCYSLGVSGRDYMAFLRLAKLIKKLQVDIVHVNNLGPWFDSCLACRLTGIESVGTFHGIESKTLNLALPRRFIYRVIASRTSAITAVSEAAQHLLVKITGIPRKRVEIVPNGVDASVFYPPQTRNEAIAARERFGLPKTGRIFVCVAALRPVKQHDELIEAFGCLMKADGSGNRFLVFAGDGPELKRLKQLALRKGVEDNVFFLGHCSDIDVLLRACDVFCLNSQTEGMSYSILEAQSSGLPVVATDVGSNPELLGNGESGFLYKVGDIDKLVTILKRIDKSGEMLRQMGENGRQRIESRFSIASMAEKYRLIYEELGKKGGGGVYR